MNPGSAAQNIIIKHQPQCPVTKITFTEQQFISWTENSLTVVENIARLKQGFWVFQLVWGCWGEGGLYGQTASARIDPTPLSGV
ncbi:MAG: hypothetical protein C7B46_10885 [Sulfobacillus benefaciens]|uniref:Uncharacterized protein n=1 Tax=Sulfobacillus benefaciens TaxID=453960 RepID=A0A2T2XFF9_9FIRM|nr:MAG: hypothetical protein C7B46_10885 [Sulfobacillus benefaciens]